MQHQLPKPLIITISFIQGIVLTWLYHSVEHHLWPSVEPVWLVSLVTFAVCCPLLVLLTITTTNKQHTAVFIIPFSLLLAALGGYVGLQQEPVKYVNNNVAIAIFCFTALIASFKALMYLQQYIDKQGISYSRLFKLSWRNFIIFGECWLFVLIFWGILNLGASLFEVLEIAFFKQLLTKDWFVIPVLNLAFGFAIIIFRNISYTVDNISTILQTLIKFLLPALTVVSLGFLVTLPFSGLGTLWKTGSGSLLVMWILALTLFFVNAVYQDESHDRPYGKLLHRLIFVGVALLPIYSIISAYGIWLRIEQYGFTVDRCWAVLVWGVLSCFSFGYLYGILKQRDAWLETLSKINITMGVTVLLLMLLVNSPFLSFQKISAQSQLARLYAGEITYDNFDYQYFGNSLGRQGYLALQKLKGELEDLAPDKVVIIERMYINTEKQEVSRENFKKYLMYWPNEQAIPTDLIDAVFKQQTQYEWSKYHNNSYYFIAQDLNKDNMPEFVVIKENNYSSNADLWLLKGAEWYSKGMHMYNPNDIMHLKSFLLNNEVKIVEPMWHELKIGDITFSVQHK